MTAAAAGRCPPARRRPPSPAWRTRSRSASARTRACRARDLRCPARRSEDTDNACSPPSRSFLPLDERARPGSTGLCSRFSPPAVVLNPVGPDLPGVDRGELAGLAGSAQVREEVGAVAELVGLEPGLQRAQDVLARMQALAVRPCPEVGVPALPRSLPLLVAIVQPAAVCAGPGQPGEAPPRGR